MLTGRRVPAGTSLALGLALWVLCAAVLAPSAAYGYDEPIYPYDVGLHSTTRVDGSSALVVPAFIVYVDQTSDAFCYYVAPSSAGIRGLANAGDELAQGGVYALRDPVTGQIVRTGHTNSLTRRAGEHFRNPDLADFEFEVIARTDVYAQQRGLEQLLHDAYSPALNRIRPISPTNPNAASYLQAAEEFLARYGGGL